MGRKNHPKHSPQFRRRPADIPAPLMSRPAPKPVEKTIVPHGRCHLNHGKLKFHEVEVQQALREAQALRRARGQLEHMERRAYECVKSKGGCGSWHLTSREQWNA